LLVAEADETVDSVELTGAGPAFCSGGDLDEFGTATDLVAAYLVRLSRAPWQVVGRIADKGTGVAHGACVGAGVEMAAYAGRGAGRRHAGCLLRAARSRHGPRPRRRRFGERSAPDRPVARGMANAHWRPAPGTDRAALGACRRDQADRAPGRRLGGGLVFG